jgi:hypothetical protein
MGRKPVGKKAMTAAERQQRRRKKLRRQKLKLARKAEKEKTLLKNRQDYVPTPPGITYWVKVHIEGREILQPTTHPLPSMYWRELRDEDLHSVIDQAQKELARRRTTTDTPTGA